MDEGFQANTGVAEMCVRQMVEEGATVEEACGNVFMIDIDGLITKSRQGSLTARHLPFAKVRLQLFCFLLKLKCSTVQDMPEHKNLLEIVQAVKPHALIGAFSSPNGKNGYLVRLYTRMWL